MTDAPTERGVAKRLADVLRLGVGFHFHAIQVAGPLGGERLRLQVVAAVADDRLPRWLEAPQPRSLQRVRYADLVDALLRPLLREDRAAGQAVIIDASNDDPRDRDAWRNWLRRCNEARDRIASALDSSLVFVLPGWVFGHLADEAPDLWSIRGYVALLPDGEPGQRQAEHVRLRLLESMDMRYRGDLDGGLRELQAVFVPALRAAGDIRGAAAAMGQVADILTARGELDEALRIRREEELPVYKRMGDVHSHTVAMRKVADILRARGEFDEALRMLREEVLPAFERPGEERERAVTMGKVADIRLARGQLDEALRIRREEQLPVYERLGDVRSLLVGRTNLAINLAERGHNEDGDEIANLLNLAWRDANRLQLPEATQVRAVFTQIFNQDLPDAVAQAPAEP